MTRRTALMVELTFLAIVAASVGVHLVGRAIGLSGSTATFLGTAAGALIGFTGVVWLWRPYRWRR